MPVQFERHRISGSIFVLSIVMVFVACSVCGQKTPARPNIIVILVDDLGYSDLGCYGGEIQTPNLDQLAENGLRFTQFYNTARCSPTRASLLTGLYPHQTGVARLNDDLGFDGYRGDLNEHCVTIAEVLKPYDYSSYMVGKWHVTKHVGQWSGDATFTSKHNWPLQRGFDRFWGTIDGHGDYFNPATLTDGNKPVAEVNEGFYYTNEISQKAAQYIREHETDQPFFLYVAYTAPHWPLHALPQDIEKYRGVYDKGWDHLRAQRHSRMKDLGVIDSDWELTPRDARVPAWEEAEDKAWQASRMMAYAAQVDSVDQGVGQIVEALKEGGQFSNTLILFVSDNGACDENLTLAWQKNSYLHGRVTHRGETTQFGNEHTDLNPGPQNTYQSYGKPWANASNTPFRLYKRWAHEGGITTPLIAHWPNRIKSQGEISHQPGHVIDFMATCVELAGADYPSHFQGSEITPMEGESLVPVLIDPDAVSERTLYWEHEGNRAVRQGKWKLVSKVRRVRQFTEADKHQWELYDLEKDRTEMHNLAAKFPKRVRSMAGLWEEWAHRSKALPWPWEKGDPLLK